MVSFKGVGSVENGNVNGVVIFPGGDYGDLNVNGVATVQGPLQAGVLDIDGVFHGQNDVTCENLKTTGVVNIDGNLQTTLANIQGVVSVHGNKVEADRIVCDGVLNVGGQVSADTIDAQGFINAEEIVGDRISIQSHTSSFFFKMWTKLKEAVGNQNHSIVDLIEATTVNLRGVHARTVSGQDITIGPGCKIDKVDASDKLFIDEDAEVGIVITKAEA